MFPFVNSFFEYTKKRKSFGRQPLFRDAAYILDSIYSNKVDQKQYILRNPVNRGVQVTKLYSENNCNTEPVETRELGINHTEGGWPRDVHLYNEDHLIRHRRRVKHEDNYVHTVLNLAPVVKHYIDQNNAVDMYETYFDDMQPQRAVEKSCARTVNIFRDSFKRSVSCVTWTHEYRPKLAVAYKHTYNYSGFNFDTYKYNTCYIWDISRQTEPVHELQPDKPCWQLACSRTEHEILIGGLENGTVNLFDTRVGRKAVSSSVIYNSHREPITSLLYVHSRTNTEFFSGSPDGQCLWWDSRNLSAPFDRLPMSIRIKSEVEPNLGNAEGISTLEFNYSLPTKFLCGTESGLVINANRMGKTHSEILASYWNTHCGPVRAVNRSPCTLRMFLTCGDYSVRIWSEEVRTSPIIVTKPYRYEVTDASWAPLRFSSYMSICSGGFFYFWDFLRKYREPVITARISKNGLTRISPHTKGKSVAIGDTEGSIFLIQLSENMVLPDTRDRYLMNQLYERETKREHILDTRLKEIYLKSRAEDNATTITTEVTCAESLEKEVGETVEEEYFHVVNSQLRQMNETISSNEISF